FIFYQEINIENEESCLLISIPTTSN
ncbi:unnamed protein product, partial [Oikopleura dioica]